MSDQEESEMEVGEEDDESTSNSLPAEEPEDQQSEKVRLQIRQQYRDLKEETQAKMEIGETGPKHVINLIKKTDGCFTKVKNTREAAMDSHQIHLISECLKRDTESLSTNLVQFRPIECAERFIRKYGSNLLEEDEDEDDTDSADGMPDEHWVAFGQKAITRFRISPAFHFMYGSFEVNPVRSERKRKPKVKDDEVVKTVRPKELSQIEKSDQETTSSDVERVHKILKELYKKNGKEPFCYFRFVTNADSFAQTVQNIFHVSFLVKDGLAGITMDGYGMPVIYPVDEKETENGKDQPTSQFILTMTMDEWQEIVQTFKIEDPYIPPKTDG